MAAEIVVDGSQSQTIQSGIDQAKAGDTVIVKPGRYPELVTFKTSGTSDAPITLRAEKPGTVLIDGADPVAGWQKAAKPEDVADTPNWKNIFFAEVPEGKTYMNVVLYEDDKYSHFAQDPAPSSDPFYYDKAAEYIPVDADTYTSTSITDPKYFHQKDANYWQGASVIVWTANNNMMYREVKIYDPETGKITYDTVGSYIHPTRDRFSMVNHLDLIRRPGEYVVKKDPATGKNTLYYWPYDEKNLDAGKVMLSVRKNGIRIEGQSNLVIEGLDLRGHYDSGIHNPYGKFTENITVRNCHVYHVQNGTGIGLSFVHNALIEDNYVHNIQFGRGIAVAGDSDNGDLPARNAMVRNNRVTRCGGTGIIFFNVAGGKMIDNLVHDNRGHHGNGITAYLRSRDILMQGNTVIRSNLAITMQQGDNFTVRDNILLGNGEDAGIPMVVASYAENLPNATFEHNIILDAPSSFHLGKNMTNYQIKANVLGGINIWTEQRPGEVVVEGNIITKKMPHSGRDASYAENNTFETDLSKIFTDAANGDFTRVKDGPLPQAGLLDGGRKIDLHPGPWKGRK